MVGPRLSKKRCSPDNPKALLPALALALIAMALLATGACSYQPQAATPTTATTTATSTTSNQGNDAAEPASDEDALEAPASPADAVSRYQEIKEEAQGAVKRVEDRAAEQAAMADQ